MSAEPPAKRQKQDMAASPWPKRVHKSALGAWSDVAPHPLRAAWLLSSPLALPDGLPSPAALQGCRVALQARRAAALASAALTALQAPSADGPLRAYVASGPQVYVHTARRGTPGGLITS